jgi:hypothetical protein
MTQVYPDLCPLHGGTPWTSNIHTQHSPARVTLMADRHSERSEEPQVHGNLAKVTCSSGSWGLPGSQDASLALDSSLNLRKVQRIHALARTITDLRSPEKSARSAFICLENNH